MKSFKRSRSITFLILFPLIFLVSGCGKADNLLPQPLYFIDGSYESAQVWRLEKDGVTRVQLTDESAGVDGFSVSPRDGTLALVSANKLYLVGPDDPAAVLIAEGSAIFDADHPSYTSQVSNPTFSPDGETLAYAWNGVHLYDLSTGVDDHMLPNPTIINGTTQDYAKGAHSPGPWAPDGSRLLVITSYYEGCMLVIMEPGVNGQLLPLQTSGAVGCQTAWSEDGRSVFAANPYLTGALPGLWQFDANTGLETLNITLDDQEQSANFIGWPYQSTDGNLYFFHANVEEFPPLDGIQLTLVRIATEGENPIPVFPEDFLIRTTLWAPDGHKVLVAGDPDGTGRQLILLDLETGTSRVLIEEADQVRNLVWGP